jgi:SAM-dependent methyltransferase
LEGQKKFFYQFMNGDLIPENYNSQNLISMWREFIDWEKRRRGEDNFLVNQFHKHNVRKVFDAALGDGCDSIYLLKQGFDVTSNEIDKIFLDKALENAKVENVKLKITSLDWRKLDEELEQSSFDAVICLGNSLTYLFTEKDQLETLRQFKRLLRNGGVLIIDERNYQYILDNREKISQGDFRYSGKYVYCGDKVHSKPIEISDSRVKMEYADERTGKKGYLILYPFKRGEMKNLLVKTGFASIEQFSDYKVGENYNADFYQYVCVK